MSLQKVWMNVLSSSVRRSSGVAFGGQVSSRFFSTKGNAIGRSEFVGIPDTQLKRHAKIIKAQPHSTQQGTSKTKGLWFIEFGESVRWTNPLMGWTSTSDPASNLKINFSSKEQAVAYCEELGKYINNCLYYKVSNS